MKSKGLEIFAVEPESIAAELDLGPGDRVLEINGAPVRDIIDYRFLESDDSISVRVIKAGGEEWIIDVEKDFDESLGLNFGGNACGRTIRCANKCLFCFVDQMPSGLRDTLYVKDDDYRLSFLNGNFITLTNLGGAELSRISGQRLSPLYISVHTTNPRLREKMLGSKSAGRIMEQLGRLAGAGIEMHTQAVLCPGLNDRSELAGTFTDLAGLWPAVRSLAVVPVGLTGHREKCDPVRSFKGAEALDVVTFVRQKQEECLGRFGYPFIFASDEFYLLAGVELPPAEGYADYPQIENGVGLTRLFLEEWQAVERDLPEAAGRPVEAVAVTGELAGPVLAKVVRRLNTVAGVRLETAVVKNNFFGGQVTVAGLITGSDIVSELSDARGKLVILPLTMLKRDEPLLLDGMTLGELAGRLGTGVAVVEGPRELAEVLLRGPEKASIFQPSNKV